MNPLLWILLILVVLVLARHNWSHRYGGGREPAANPKVGKFIINYGGTIIKAGEIIDHKIARLAPKITYEDASPEKYYTIMTVDPDAPSHETPTFREWRHWVVGNIPGKKLATGFDGQDENIGSVITTYQYPTPPPDSGYHRYYTKLYEQPHEIVFQPLPGDRRNWKSRKYAETLGLKKIVQKHFLTRRVKQ